MNPSTSACSAWTRWCGCTEAVTMTIGMSSSAGSARIIPTIHHPSRRGMSASTVITSGRGMAGSRRISRASTPSPASITS